MSNACLSWTLIEYCTVCSIQYLQTRTGSWFIDAPAHCLWPTQDTAAALLNISTPCQDYNNSGPGLDQPTLSSFRKHVFDSRKMVAIISNFTLIFIIFIKTRFRVHCITTRTGHISSDKKSNKVVSVYFICFWKVLWTARIFIYWTFKTILDRHIQRNRVVFRNIF